MNETIKTELYHKWSKDEKKRYNREYYQKHKGLWKKYRLSDRETMGDNDVLLRKAENSLADAKKRANRADELKTQAFKDAQKNKKMAERAAAAGIPRAAEALRSTAYDKYATAKDYLGQKNYIKNKQINPLEGSVAYRQALKYKGYGDAASRPAPSARVENKRAVKTKTTINPVTGVEIKSTSKTGNLDWKLKPVKNKAARKAKEFVSNWKSGATSISGAVKSASSKLGKSFLRW